MSSIYCEECRKELDLKVDVTSHTMYVGICCKRCGKVLIEEVNGKIRYNR
jgi:phage FluMu protein Com